MRADRLLSMLLLLQSQGHLTAQELAQRLQVSERTVYRDIDALSAAGIPVYTQAGIGGGVFMDNHYRQSFNALSQDEIHKLFSSWAANLKEADIDMTLNKAVENSVLTMMEALPTVHREHVERRRQRIYFDPNGWLPTEATDVSLPLIQQALWEDREIEVVYHPSTGGIQVFNAHPYGLVARGSVWYLVARVGEEMRVLGVSQINRVTVSDEAFVRDGDFDLVSFWGDQAGNGDPTLHRVSARLRVTPEGRAFFETYFQSRYEPEPDPAILRVAFNSMDEACNTVLLLGTKVEVLAPIELKEKVVAVAKAIVDSHAARSG